MNNCKNCGKIIANGKIYCNQSCRNVFVNKNLRDYSQNGYKLKIYYRSEYEKNPKKCKLCNNDINYDKRHNLHFLGFFSYSLL